MEKLSVCGVILAGGASRRMGRPKELLSWGGQPLLLHLAKSVQAAALPCLVISNEPERLPLATLQAMGVAWSRDLLPASGPVSGLCTAFRLRQEAALLVLACDLPFVDPRQIKLLLAQTEQLHEWDAVIPEQGGRLHPLFALYHQRTHGWWEAAQRSGELRLLQVLERLRIKRLPEGYLDRWATFNMNTPQAYRQALQERKRRDALSPSTD
ncbi:molybdenum cofactor guanylyltransferase [Brevibacillus marinus]|uniref:molybdenum cofactor guanylyltransferase n=1 Tax=Brevibacillus marinus TaxID=2496837 RepID=UPI000F81E463|nr:molybdenum cofactor guanylyltransferase [Brevibacillus marinus]